jgi:hypothetical protein
LHPLVTAIKKNYKTSVELDEDEHKKNVGISRKGKGL